MMIALSSDNPTIVISVSLTIFYWRLILTAGNPEGTRVATR